MTTGRPGGRPLIVLAALSVAAGVLAFSGGPASAAVTCPTVNPTTGEVSPTPSAAVDWQGCYLANAALSGADLANADLSQALLTGANLGNANLDGANLGLSDLQGATLTGASLDGTALSGSVLNLVISGGISGTPASLPANWVLADSYLAGPAAELANASLNGADLAGDDLLGADLTDASLGDADLKGTDLYAATLATTDLAGADLDGTDLYGANLGKANLTSAVLTGADLGATAFDGAALAKVKSGAITGMPASLPDNWTLAAGYLAGPDADLSGASMDSADLVGADLAGADLSGASARNLGDANLTDANLTNAIIEYGSFSGANLTDANLTHADLYRTTFYGADLTHASLADANLTDGTLSVATLTGTNLAGANLTGVAGWALTGTPSSLPAHWSLRDYCLIGPGALLSGASLTGADLAATDLAGASLSKAYLASSNLTGANLGKADLSGADLDGANLTRATLVGATITGAELSGITWSDTTCPNGANSNLYAAGCLSQRLYGFAGFISPARKSTLPVSSHQVTVTFRLTNAAGKPIASSTAAKLAAAREVRVTFTGQNIKAVIAYCAWKTAAEDFACVVKIPNGIKTGKARPYFITVAENLGPGFKTAPADGSTVNPEYIYFK
jgi:uncharacterized protein YjbI with pentapeptide repeats